MDRNSKIFFVVFFSIILLMVWFVFVKYIIAKDYFVKFEVDCDPTKESCFVYHCDPEVDGECPADQEEGTSYYKLIQKKAMYIPVCEEESGEPCPAIMCNEGEDCEETLCDVNKLGEGEECSSLDFIGSTNVVNENNPSTSEEDKLILVE